MQRCVAHLQLRLHLVHGDQQTGRELPVVPHSVNKYHYHVAYMHLYVHCARACVSACAYVCVYVRTIGARPTAASTLVVSLAGATSTLVTSALIYDVAERGRIRSKEEL
jgi:hypothetical protein